MSSCEYHMTVLLLSNHDVCVTFGIRYYSTSIFCQIGVQEFVSTALVGTLNFLTTFVAIVLVDKVSLD